MNFKWTNQSKQHLTHCGAKGQLKASGRFGYRRIRAIVLGCLAAIWLAAGNEVALARFDETKSTQQQLESWIKDLGSSDYSKRQLATLNLGMRKDEAISLAIQAIDDANGEGADRLLQFISSIASDPYSESGKLAFDSLKVLASSRSTGKSIRAEKILQVIGAEQREIAIGVLGQYNAPLRDRRIQVMSGSTEEKSPLVIDRKFSGTADDLGCLKWLTDVQLARLEGPGISREMLQQVLLLPHLKRLQLVETELIAADLAVLRDGPDLDLLELVYSPIGDEAVELLTSLPVWGNVYLFGTKLTENGQQALKYKLDGQELFVSRGGFLGVQSIANSTKISVVPGGAAEKAGLKDNDRLLSVNGIPIAVFDDLRKQLAKFADGEKVKLEYEGIRFVPNENPTNDLPMRGMLRRERGEVEVTLGRKVEVQLR